jgi:hypothetical protein
MQWREGTEQKWERGTDRRRTRLQVVQAIQASEQGRGEEEMEKTDEVPTPSQLHTRTLAVDQPGENYPPLRH